MKTENIRVLHILASSFGGGATHVADLIVHGPPSLKQRLTLSPDDGGSMADMLRKLGQEIEEVDLSKGWKWDSFVKLIRMIRKFQPSIVHCHGFRAGLYGRLAAKFASRKTKTILTVHGFHYFYYRNQLKRKLFIFLERILRPFTDHVIAVSKTDWQHLFDCKLISREKSCVILNGIPPAAKGSLDRQEIRTRLNFPSSQQPIIATIARLHYQKGVIYFLQSIPAILRGFPDACFLIAGDGPEREDLERAARELNIHGNTRFLGDRKDVVDILAVADVFVLSSLWEGLPLSLLEAMRADLPVVATDVDGNRDVVENGVSGLLVPPNNGKAIGEAVLRFLHDPSFGKNMAEKAKNRLNTDFSLENMLKKNHETYVDLLKI